MRQQRVIARWYASNLEMTEGAALDDALVLTSGSAYREL